MQDCIFCMIVAGAAPSHKIWEDEKHVAFLSIFPNTKGFSVVVTKEHYPSYAFDVPEDVLKDLTVAAKKVGKLLDKKLGVGRTGLMFEGFGVDHIHAKLFPMHGTANMKEWKELDTWLYKYFDRYEGYMSSHNGKRADDGELAALAKKIRE